MDADIEHLISAITALDATATTMRLRDLFAALDRLNARVAAAVDTVDRSGQVAADGAVNTAHWLRTCTGRTAKDAASLLERARRTGACPPLAAAWADGELSSGQVEAVVVALNDRNAAMFADHATAVVPTLVGLPVRDTAIAMGHWATHADALIDGPAPVDHARVLRLSPGLDGGLELSGRLDAAGHQIVTTALDAATTPDTDGEPARSIAQRRADALVTISQFFLDHHVTATGSRRRPHVQVVVTLADLEHGAGRSVDGQPLDPGTINTLLCDAGIHRFITDGAAVTLDAGRATRTVNHHLFAALAFRDHGCRFPGCDRPVSWCEAHHVVPWQHGGTTAPDNLVLLCWRHHHDFAHDPQWQLKLLPDGTVEVTKPDGTTVSSRPPPPTTFAAVCPTLSAAGSPSCHPHAVAAYDVSIDERTASLRRATARLTGARR